MEPIPAKADASPQEERTIASWTEPELSEPPFSARTVTVVIAAAVLAVGGLVTLGVLQREASFFLGAVAALAGAAAVVMQNRTRRTSSKITLTTLNLVVGSRRYPLADLAGFWLQQEEGHVVANVEPRKRALVPVTFFCPTTDLEESRRLLLATLPEVEPRETTVTDAIGSFIRF